MYNYRIILSSRSPRRRELLKGLDLPVETAADCECDETCPAGLEPEAGVMFIAEKKSDAYPRTLLENEILVTADTMVLFRGELLGKPRDADDAARMLAALSGNRHEVVTGVCLRSARERRVFCESSSVYFAQLTDEEIDYYVSRYSPLDKAGAYGVQEWIGYVAVERIEGSYCNVMGLPVSRLWKELKDMTRSSIL
ncbi:MAG: Maf family nucleotide pyrophosphatase [Prevotellaceae bacterium]|jgi:septum formation protein|nr:Maf family nucleotide pyrophosphatase [Prevotellaceae bacterium]